MLTDGYVTPAVICPVCGQTVWTYRLTRPGDNRYWNGMTELGIPTGPLVICGHGPCPGGHQYVKADQGKEATE